MNMKAFVIQKNLAYRECFINDGIINKFYELENDGKIPITTVPDACVDLQFVIEDGKCIPYACGSFLEGMVSPTGKYRKCFGVKFNPGVIPNCIREEVGEIINGRSDLQLYSDLTYLCEEICNGESFEDKLRIFQSRFDYDKNISQQNDMVDYAVNEINRKMGVVNISDMANDMGYNHKYIDRVFKNSLGMSLKKYAIIIRVQKAIHFLQKDTQDEIYNSLGYYDQAHFIRDFKRHTCLTPNQYMKHRQERAIV